MENISSSKNLVRFGSDFFLAICMQILALWIAFGDAIIQFAASYVKVFDDISFDDFDDFSKTSDSSVELSTFRRDILRSHNFYRTLHGCPILTMSRKLNSKAQAWANQLAHRGILLYNESPGVGQNICLLDLEKPTVYNRGEQVAREWYNEIFDYDYKDPGWKRDSFRATQLLWKESRELGVGLAKIPDQNQIYVVVYYQPAGNSNKPGDFKWNILPRRHQDNSSTLLAPQNS